MKVVSPEIGNLTQVLDDKTKVRIKNVRARHNKAVKKGIELCEAAVFEVSYESLGIGTEISLALSLKKPVLVLSSTKDYSDHIQHELYQASLFEPDKPAKSKAVIQDFLAFVRTKSQAQRFNMFLYPHQLGHLEEAGKGLNMNKSEYVRHLINQDKLG